MLAVFSTAMGVVLSNGKLEMCYNYQAASHKTSQLQQKMNCTHKLVVTVAVENGQNASERIHAIAAVQDLTQGGGSAVKVLQDDITITVSKSPIFVRYATVYEQTFNNQPWELVKLARNVDIFGGTPFGQGCKAGASDDSPTCGWVDQGNVPIKDSQGFCCACDTIGMITSPGGSRAKTELKCEDVSLSVKSSAHCMRIDPLDYHAFAIGAPETWFEVKVDIKWCTKQGSCRTSQITLGPGGTSATYTQGGRTSAGIDSKRSVIAALVGDFAAWTSPVVLSDRFLFAPALESNCNGDGHGQDPSRPNLNMRQRCHDRILAGSSEWMFIEKHRVTKANSGECNKIGSSYSAFRGGDGIVSGGGVTGGVNCAKPHGHCFRNQIQDLYEQDVKRLKDGHPTHYFASGIGGSTLQQFQFSSNGNSGNFGRVSFRTSRKQSTLVQLVLDADQIRWEVIVHPGKIVDAYLGSFEQNKQTGTLSVFIADLGVCTSGGACSNADFKVTVSSCTKGIQPMHEQSTTLVAGQITDPPLQWTVHAETGINLAASGAFHHCTISLRDAAHNVIDARIIFFNTTATGIVTPHRGVGGQDTEGEAAHLPSLSSSSICSTLCSGFDLVCLVKNFMHCFEKLLYWCAVAVACVVLVVLFVAGCRVFGTRGCIQIVCFPAKCLCGAIKCIDALPRCRSRHPRAAETFFGSTGVSDEWNRRRRVRQERSARRKSAALPEVRLNTIAASENTSSKFTSVGLAAFDSTIVGEGKWASDAHTMSRGEVTYFNFDVLDLESEKLNAPGAVRRTSIPGKLTVSAVASNTTLFRFTPLPFADGRDKLHPTFTHPRLLTPRMVAWFLSNSRQFPALRDTD